MAWCPITKEQCTDECAWFKKSRRRYQDGRQNGECSFIGLSYISDRLKEVTDSIKTLNETIKEKSFSD